MAAGTRSRRLFGVIPKVITGTLVKAGGSNPTFPSVIPPCTPPPLCSGKGQILTDYATVEELRGRLRDSSSVCGVRAPSLIKPVKTSSGVLMKNLLFFGGGGWKSINRTFLADEISGVTFKGFLSKRSHVRHLTPDNRTSCQSRKRRLGSDCASRPALC